MKSISTIVIVALGLLIVGFIIKKEVARSSEIPTALLGEVRVDSIKKIRRIHGKILPAEEIKVKSKINGIVEEVYVEIGQKIKAGQKVIKVRNLSEPRDIENLRSAVNLYTIQLEKAELNYKREIELIDKGISSKIDFEQIEAHYFQVKEQLSSAKKKLQMATTGVNTEEKDLSNIVYAPATGIVLSLLSKPGSPVIRQNNYNEGTTIAIIADMDSLMFFGDILESDLSQITEGQPVTIELNVTDTALLTGYIHKIYPKGNDWNGIIKFPIEAIITKRNCKLWGGIHATALVTTIKKDSVLCIEEKYLIYEKDSIYVNVKNAFGKFHKRNVLAGISDGIKTEIVEGIELGDLVKLPDELQ